MMNTEHDEDDDNDDDSGVGGALPLHSSTIPFAWLLCRRFSLCIHDAFVVMMVFVIIIIIVGIRMDARHTHTLITTITGQNV